MTGFDGTACPDKLLAIGNELLPYLDEWGRKTFLPSVLAQYMEKQYLSEKQWNRIRVIHEKALQAKNVADNPQLIEKFEIGDNTKVKAHLLAAKMKQPKIRVQFDEGKKFYFYVLGGNSRSPGNVAIDAYFKEDGVGKWLQFGVWEGTMFTPEPGKELPEQIEAFATLLSISIDTAMRYYADTTGRCIYCDTPLSNEWSQRKGYGPICARNYGLPY